MKARESWLRPVETKAQGNYLLNAAAQWVLGYWKNGGRLPELENVLEKYFSSRQREKKLREYSQQLKTNKFPNMPHDMLHGLVASQSKMLGEELLGILAKKRPQMSSTAFQDFKDFVSASHAKSSNRDNMQLVRREVYEIFIAQLLRDLLYNKLKVQARNEKEDPEAKKLFERLDNDEASLELDRDYMPYLEEVLGCYVGVFVPQEDLHPYYDPQAQHGLFEDGAISNKFNPTKPSILMLSENERFFPLHVIKFDGQSTLDELQAELRGADISLNDAPKNGEAKLNFYSCYLKYYQALADDCSDDFLKTQTLFEKNQNNSSEVEKEIERIKMQVLMVELASRYSDSLLEKVQTKDDAMFEPAAACLSKVIGSTAKVSAPETTPNIDFKAFHNLIATAKKNMGILGEKLNVGKDLSDDEAAYLCLLTKLLFLDKDIDRMIHGDMVSELVAVLYGVSELAREKQGAQNGSEHVEFLAEKEEKDDLNFPETRINSDLTDFYLLVPTAKQNVEIFKAKLESNEELSWGEHVYLALIAAFLLPERNRVGGMLNQEMVRLLTNVLNIVNDAIWEQPSSQNNSEKNDVFESGEGRSIDGIEKMMRDWFLDDEQGNESENNEGSSADLPKETNNADEKKLEDERVSQAIKNNLDTFQCIAAMFWEKPEDEQLSVILQLIHHRFLGDGANPALKNLPREQVLVLLTNFLCDIEERVSRGVSHDYFSKLTNPDMEIFRNILLMLREKIDSQEKLLDSEIKCIESMAQSLLSKSMSDQLKQLSSNEELVNQLISFIDMMRYMPQQVIERSEQAIEEKSDSSLQVGFFANKQESEKAPVVTPQENKKSFKEVLDKLKQKVLLPNARPLSSGGRKFLLAILSTPADEVKNNQITYDENMIDDRKVSDLELLEKVDEYTRELIAEARSEKHASEVKLSL